MAEIERIRTGRKEQTDYPDPDQGGKVQKENNKKMLGGVWKRELPSVPREDVFFRAVLHETKYLLSCSSVFR